MLLVVPIVAVVVLLLATWKWGGVRDAVVHGADEARTILAVEHPEWRPTLVTPSLDARGAIACAPPDESVAIVFAHGDTLTSRLLHVGDLSRLEERADGGPPAPSGVEPATGAGPSTVHARLHLYDIGCPHLDVRLPRRAWDEWRPRLQRLVGAMVAVLTTALGEASAQVPAQVPATSSSACTPSLRATFTPPRPQPGTLVVVQLTGWDAAAPPAGRAAGESLHFRADSAGRWRAFAAVPIDSARALALRVACPDAPGDSMTVTLPLATASYPLEKLRVAPEFSARPDSALQARMRREAERAAAVSQASHETPRLWASPFRAPRDSRVTSTFGRGREFNGSVTSRHMGTDYAGAVGAPVRAANRGIVRLVDRFYLGGNVVYLDHGEGLVTAYLHLSRHRVAEGDTVERGAVIGSVGATGRVTGPHLHWIARYGRVSVDPASLLRVTGGGAGRKERGGRSPTKQ